MTMAALRIRQRLAEIKLPTPAIWGDKDTWINFDNVLHIVRRISGCRLYVFRGVGHDTLLEVPGPFTGMVVDFVEAARARAPAP